MPAAAANVESGRRKTLSPWAIPLVVGVTGHRDIPPEDAAVVAQRLKGVFDRLAREHPSTPIVALSPLAEGADRLFAKAALDHGAELLVALPMAVDDYERDFGTESRAEFQALLKAGQATFVVPVGDWERQAAGDSPRARCYARVGAFISRNCHLLVALWDGRGSSGMGGTSEIVSLRLNGFPDPTGPPESALDASDVGPVVHIEVRRGDLRPGAPQWDAEATVRTPDGSSCRLDELKRLGPELARLENFNRDLTRRRRALTGIPAVCKAFEPGGGDIPSGAVSLYEHRAAAAVLARRYAAGYRRWTLGFFAVCLWAAIAFAAHIIFADGRILAVYAGLLLIAILIYQYAKRSRLQNRHLDYRALAEGMRVEFFWHLAGVASDASARYLRKQRSELDWIRRALRATRMKTRLFVPHSVANGRFDQMLLDSWLSEQQRYYAVSAASNLRAVDRAHHVARMFFWAGLLAIGGVAAVHWLAPAWAAREPRLVSIIAFVGIFPAISATFVGYVDRMAFGPQGKRYEWMAGIFGRARVRVEVLFETKDKTAEQVAIDRAAARQLILEVGTEALEENADWVMAHRERPPTMPIG
jgi:hypothetical protein